MCLHPIVDAVPNAMNDRQAAKAPKKARFEQRIRFEENQDRKARFGLEECSKPDGSILPVQRERASVAALVVTAVGQVM